MPNTIFEHAARHGTRRNIWQFSRPSVLIPLVQQGAEAGNAVGSVDKGARE